MTKRDATIFQGGVVPGQENGQLFEIGMLEPSVGGATGFNFGPPSCGFEWITNVRRKEKVLTVFDDLPDQRLLVMKRALPLEWRDTHSISDSGFEDLYRKFGEMEPTEEMILEFASKCGPLGTHAEILPGAQIESRDMNPYGGFGPTAKLVWQRHPWKLGESLADWRSRIGEMRVVLDLSAAIDGRDVGQLKEWIRISESGIELHRDEFVNPIRLRLYPTKDREFTNAARRMITHIANTRLRERTSISMFPTRRGGQRFEFEVFTATLLGALWVQFLDQTITGGIRRCKHCREMISIGKRGKRADTKFCGDNCRQAARRHRVKSRRAT